MLVRLIARPQFIEIPEECGTPSPSQMQGPDGQKLIELAGRTCYESVGAKNSRSSEDYAKHLMEVGHGSPTEHAQYSFYIEGVSRSLTHEMVRHRVGVGISQRSSRFCDESDSPWMFHPLMESLLQEEPEFSKRVDDLVDQSQLMYDLIVSKIQERLEARGTDKLTARKQARGAARGVLGNALETKLVWSANVRALRHFITMRADSAADAEIRLLAIKIWEIMVEELPAYFSDFEKRTCPDGIGYALVPKYRKV